MRPIDSIRVWVHETFSGHVIVEGYTYARCLDCPRTWGVPE